MAQVLEQVGDEPADVEPLLRELLDVRERARGVVVDDEVAEAEQRLLVGCAEQLEHGLDRDLAAGRRRELVERRHGVAEASLRGSRDERQRRVRHVEALAVRDPAQEDDELREARPLEQERLAARTNGREHLVERRRAEHEDEMRRRLLDDLQQRVPGGVRQLVRLVEDVDLVAARRLKHRAVADRANVVDPALRGRVHLDDVERAAVGDRDACLARPVGLRRRAMLAVERLRENACERRLTRAAGAGEEIRLAHAAPLERVPQRPRHRLLPDHLVEVLRRGT